MTTKEKWIQAQNSQFWLQIHRNTSVFELGVYLTKDSNSLVVTVVDTGWSAPSISFSGLLAASPNETRQMASALQLAASIASDIDSWRAELDEHEAVQTQDRSDLKITSREEAIDRG